MRTARLATDLWAGRRGNFERSPASDWDNYTRHKKPPAVRTGMAEDANGPPDTSRALGQETGRESGSLRTQTGAPRRGVLPYVVLVVVTFLVTWFVFATLTGYPVGLGSSPSSTSGGATPVAGVILTINNPFDTAMNASADQYAPANFTVPAHTLLEFTLINYDTGQNAVTSLEATVNGTVGNCIYVNSTPASLGPCVHSVPTGFVVHTFSFESGPYAGFNVPIPSAVKSTEGGIGSSVTFFAYFNETGTFTWNCLAPCDPFSMATSGFMTGTMTVGPK
jgi:hypothetical protein